MMKLSLATRIFLGYAAVLVTFSAVSIFSVWEMHQSQGEMRLLGEGYLRLIKVASALEGFPDNERRELERIHDEANPALRRALIRLVRLFPPSNAAQLAEARHTAGLMLLDAPPSERRFISDLVKRLETLEQRYTESERLASSVCDTLSQDLVNTGELAQRWGRYQGVMEKFSRDIKQLRPELEERVRGRVQAAGQREQRVGIAILGLSLLAIFVGLLATGISSRALAPVRTLVQGVSRIGKGDYSAQLGVQGKDEIALLAREFDAMARSLQEREAQLKEKQEALLRAEQLAAVGRISAQVAHEVRNPLSSIGLNMELLQESFARSAFPTEASAKEAQDVLASVLREVDRLTEVTEQYLGMARLPKPTLVPEDLNSVLGSVLDFSRSELERAKVTVVRDLDPTAPSALADEGQLRQVFLNLVRNSKEAMAPGGTLKVASRGNGTTVEITFTDSGAGVPPEVQNHIFEPFFSTKEGGTGLGLALSRQILQSHGGTIACERAESGRGTRFVIRLPRG